MEVALFPAVYRKADVVSTGDAVLAEGESSCFFHAEKKASIACDRCGRFLCGLCDIQLGNEHICATCIESGKKKGKMQKLENKRLLRDRQALVLSIVPLFLTGITALYLTTRYRKDPTSISITQKSRWRFSVAWMFSVLQILIGIFLILSYTGVLDT
ncbi:MAG: hypothetical protein CMO80_00175 [Verrucomicrobiales bacterium]|nr:hypothetical protein [Verrucomicrobiales bacterium]|tara:strand:+ start:171 stop:641 length:471 start_codon:yes stop_codon:yes gene_type:complete